MNTITIEDLTEKLKNAPSSILKKIWVYADTLLENDKATFSLSDDQKKVLLDQENISVEECIDAEDFYQELKNKYEL